MIATTDTTTTPPPFDASLVEKAIRAGLLTKRGSHYYAGKKAEAVLEGVEEGISVGQGRETAFAWLYGTGLLPSLETVEVHTGPFRYSHSAPVVIFRFPGGKTGSLLPGTIYRNLPKGVVEIEGAFTAGHLERIG